MNGHSALTKFSTLGPNRKKTSCRAWVRTSKICVVSRSLRTDPRHRQALRNATQLERVRIRVHSPRPGFAHPAGKQDVRAVLDAIGPEAWYACASSSCARPRTSIDDRSFTAGPEHPARSSCTNNRRTKPRNCRISCGSTFCCTSLDIMCFNTVLGSSTACDGHRNMNGLQKCSRAAGNRRSELRSPDLH